MGMKPANRKLKNIGLPQGLIGKESACNAGDTGDMGSIPGSGISPGGWQPTPLNSSENHKQTLLVRKEVHSQRLSISKKFS